MITLTCLDCQTRTNLPVAKAQKIGWQIRKGNDNGLCPPCHLKYPQPCPMCHAPPTSRCKLYCTLRTYP